MGKIIVVEDNLVYSRYVFHYDYLSHFFISFLAASMMVSPCSNTARAA